MNNRVENKYKKILLIYIEPTPYILVLMDAIKKVKFIKTTVFFLFENNSQQWNLNLKNEYKVLPKNNIKKFISVLHQIKKEKYDCIHLAGWNSFLFVLLVFIAKIKGITVTMESDTPMPYGVPLWKRVVKKLLYPPLFYFVDGFLCGGKRQVDYVKSYYVKPEKAISVQMTVDVAYIQQYVKNLKENKNKHREIRESYNLKETDVVFLFVGRLVADKGILDLISVFNEIDNQHAKLLIVGAGDLRDEVEKAIKMNNKIHYLGRLSNNKIVDAYYASDIMVLPSCHEPWGLVVNEAMAVGLPVIVSDRVGCIDDLVIQNETGFIFPFGQKDKLKQAMEQLLEQFERRKTMGEKAAEKIASWTLENEAEKMCSAWQDL